jgi:hypothetical protein
MCAECVNIRDEIEGINYAQIAEILAAAPFAQTACGSLQPRPTLKRAAGDLSKRAPILGVIRGAADLATRDSDARAPAASRSL